MKQKSKWVETITSRKLWAAVANFVTMMIVATGGSVSKGEQIAALIIAGASVIAYIVAQGLVDTATVNAKAEVSIMANHDTTQLIAESTKS